MSAQVRLSFWRHYLNISYRLCSEWLYLYMPTGSFDHSLVAVDIRSSHDIFSPEVRFLQDSTSICWCIGVGAGHWDHSESRRRYVPQNACSAIKDILIAIHLARHPFLPTLLPTVVQLEATITHIHSMERVLLPVSFMGYFPRSSLELGSP